MTKKTTKKNTLLSKEQVMELVTQKMIKNLNTTKKFVDKDDTLDKLQKVDIDAQSYYVTFSSLLSTMVEKELITKKEAVDRFDKLRHVFITQINYKPEDEERVENMYR